MSTWNIPNPARLPVTLLLFALSAAPAVAVPTLRVESTCAEARLIGGKTFDVKIGLATGGAVVGAAGFALAFDPAMSVDSAEKGAALPAANDVAADTASPPGTARVLVFPRDFPVPALPDGELVRLRLRAGETAAEQCGDLAFTVVNFSDTEAGFRIDGAGENGSIQSCPSGVSSICCVLREIERRASAGDLGEPKLENFAPKKITKICNLTDKIAALTEGKKRTKLLKGLRKKLGKLAKALDRKTKDETLEAQLASLVVEAQGALDSVVTP